MAYKDFRDLKGHKQERTAKKRNELKDSKELKDRKEQISTVKGSEG